MKTFFTIGLLAVAALSSSVRPALAASMLEADMDPRFRAKIVKEKLKMKSLEFDFMRNGQDGSEPQCGSQNIGNVDTGGKIGRGPREVFVFAPNAINLVDGRGCR